MLIGATELYDRLVEMPKVLYKKYWMAKALQEPFEDDDAVAVIIEFPTEVGAGWIRDYFNDPVTGPIDCHCRARNTVSMMTTFYEFHEKGDSLVTKLM